MRGDKITPLLRGNSSDLSHQTTGFETRTQRQLDPADVHNGHRLDGPTWLGWPNAGAANGCVVRWLWRGQENPDTDIWFRKFQTLLAKRPVSAHDNQQRHRGSSDEDTACFSYPAENRGGRTIGHVPRRFSGSADGDSHHPCEFGEVVDDACNQSRKDEIRDAYRVGALLTILIST